MDTVTISHTENGILKVKINATKLERFAKPESIVRISNSLEVFYDSKEKIKSFLSAKNAEINETTNIMTAFDQVVLNSVNGKKLETEELIWDDKKILFILINVSLSQQIKKLFMVQVLNLILILQNILSQKFMEHLNIM